MKLGDRLEIRGNNTFLKFNSLLWKNGNKILSVFLIAMLLGAVTSTGSLYSINIKSTKNFSQNSDSILFPSLEPNLAWGDHKRSHVIENCDTPEQPNDAEIRNQLFNGTKLGKQHPQFAVNKTSDIKVKGKSGNDVMIKVQSPFGKLVSEKQKDKDGKFREDITVNCHKLLEADKIKANATHNTYKIKTFTSVKIKPMNGTSKHENEQVGWGSVVVKSNGTLNAPDMGLNLTDFATGEVFLDSSTAPNSQYDLGEFVYSNVTDTSKVDTTYVRQFANYTNLPLNVFVKSTDDDHGKSPIEFFNATIRYFDRNSNNLFGANETIYLDTEPFGIISANDIRLANARFVGNIEEPEFQFRDGLKASILNGTKGQLIYQSFIEECQLDKMGTYNYTSDTCDFTKKYGMKMEKEASDKGFKIKFKNKGPDLNRRLTEFTNNYVFVDKNGTDNKIGILDVNEPIYYHDSSSAKIKEGDIRLANSIDGFEEGSKVKGGDADITHSFISLDSTDYKFYDADNSGDFTIGETIYEDINPKNKVNGMTGKSSGDIRLVNAKMVGDEFADGSEVYKNGLFEDMTMGCKDNNGNKMKCEPMEIGFEERQFNVTEDLELTVANNATNTTAAIDSALSSLADPLSFEQLGLDEDGPTLRTFEKVILFGDTVVPHVRFGFGLNLETCFWLLGCITWFKIGIVFTPYLMAGFRLPGRVTVHGVPDREFSSKSFDIDSNFDGFDASYQDFLDICNDDRNSLKTGGYFGPNTPFDCDDFASYDAMSIPSVINEFAPDLTEIFNNSGCTFDINEDDFVKCDFSRLAEAPGEFIKVGSILFNPLPPLGINDVKQRIIDSGLNSTITERDISELIAGQEIVLKAGVIVEIELEILDREIFDTTQKVEVDLLGMIQGFLLYNEIVASSNPTIFNGDYAIQTKLSDNICKLDKIHDRCYLEGANFCDEGVDPQGKDLKNSELVELALVAGWIDKFSSEYAANNSTLPECEPSPRADYKAIWDLITSYEDMQEAGVIFTSFETPYGLDDEGNALPFPLLGPDVAGIPVISNTEDPFDYNLLFLRGNCVEAFKTGQILKIPAPYGPLPLCNGLWKPGIIEAILGIKTTLSSLKVDAQLLPEGDVASMPDQDSSFGLTCPTWTSYSNEENIEERKDDRNISYCAYLEDTPATNGTLSSNVTRTITVDNYDATPYSDEAKITIDKFLYNLQLVVQGDLLIAFEDPVKFFLPDEYKTVKIPLFVEDIPTGIGFPQHPRIAGFGGGDEEDVFVINYAVGIENDGDPINQPNGTKPIREDVFVSQPDKRSNSTVTYTNIGNSLDKIQDLYIEFPELSQDNPGIPWVSIPNQTELDSIFFDNMTRDDSEQLVLGINPPRHWSTKPSYLPEVGFYDVTVYATSSNATKYDMPEREPPNGRGESGLGALRINATDVLKINVTQFGAPDLNFTEAITQSNPGELTEYNATISNFGNGNDTIPLMQKFVDSNTANCDLFEKGPDNQKCPYRAQFTALHDGWTNSTELCDVFWQGVLPCNNEIPEPTLPLIPPDSSYPGYTNDTEIQKVRQYGLLPASSKSQNFTITIPGNWAGVDDTVYILNGTVFSTADKGESDTEFVQHLVKATKESSIRYVGLEIEDMKENVSSANTPDMIDKGSKNALTQILDKAIEEANQRALQIVCIDSRMGPNQALSAAQRQLEGLIHAIDGMSPKNINDVFAQELKSKANATIEDIGKAIENANDPPRNCEEDFGKGKNKAVNFTPEIPTLSEDSSSNESTQEVPQELEDTSTNETIPDKTPKTDNDRAESNESQLIEKPVAQPQSKPLEKVQEPIVKNDNIIDEEPVFSWKKFHQWTEYSDSKISDKEFLEHIGINASEIPAWMKNNNAKWVEQKTITQKEFVLALQNLKSRGII